MRAASCTKREAKALFPPREHPRSPFFLFSSFLHAQNTRRDVVWSLEKEVVGQNKRGVLNLSIAIDCSLLPRPLPNKPPLTCFHQPVVHFNNGSILPPILQSRRKASIWFSDSWRLCCDKQRDCRGGFRHGRPLRLWLPGHEAEEEVLQ